MENQTNNTENNNQMIVARNNELAQFNFFNPEYFENIQRVAGMFAHSELVPEIYKVSSDNPKDKAIANCVIAIDMANRLGANVLMVMQNLVPIYGKPSWSSKFLIATVNTCGRFEPLKFKFKEIGELKNYKYQEYEWTENNGKKYTKLVDKTLSGPIQNIECIAYTKKKGSDDILESSPVSIELAIKEGWFTKKGSKWQTMPKQMLMYRAASWWTNVYAPDLSMGMKTVEESIDIEEVDFEEIQDENIKSEINDNANKQPIDVDLSNKSEEKKKPEKKEPENKKSENKLFENEPGF